MEKGIDHYGHAIMLFNRRIEKSFEVFEYIARLEKRQFELSINLTIADWKAIRDTEYWKQINQIQENDFWDRMEKEIMVNEIRGKCIRRYLDSKKINL
ncbi:hypothetical protein [Phaeodactylibacter xiamenensis]|jgi:predicted nuclease of restriction endonuclease-like RecB superfamily|uniref:hypothetical protein n=1 Tax=Phaeodactylibacter xiamenensis TaxID=1524460 RepID=UPI0024A9BDC3|nr:hypothetical protein [Phaeodactylibacter xiamenensis]